MEARQKAKEMGMSPNFSVSYQIENKTYNDQEWFFNLLGFFKFIFFSLRIYSGKLNVCWLDNKI